MQTTATAAAKILTSTTMTRAERAEALLVNRALDAAADYAYASAFLSRDAQLKTLRRYERLVTKLGRDPLA